jgi:hypothetical protein
MIPRVRNAEYVRDFVIKVYFTDDAEGEIDFEVVIGDDRK